MRVVQIGTNTGLDDTRNFCLSHKPDHILLVEPFDIHLDSIKRNYSDIIDNVIIENIAIHHLEDVSNVILYYTDLDGPIRGPKCNYEVTSMIPQHLIKHGYAPSCLKTFNIPCMTLNKLFEKYNITEIDYLFLDIEGIDFEVLQTIDFNRVNIKNIQIEFLHMNTAILLKFMKDKGYTKGQTIGTTTYDWLFYK